MYTWKRLPLTSRMSRSHQPDVMLRSRDGTLHFNTFNNRVVGGVNLTDVSHGGINLSPAHFDNGPAGHIDSVIALPNGTSAIKIRKQ